MNELVVRVTLVFFIVAVWLALLSRESTRRWLVEERWRLLIFVLFPLGAAVAMSDPYHPIRNEGNWIRYATTTAFVVGGVLGVLSAMRPVHPIAERLFGGTFGLAMIGAGANELFELDERAGKLAERSFRWTWRLDAQDAITLGIAAAAVTAFCGARRLRRSGGAVGRAFRHPRYTVPLRLFGLAAVTLFAAMLLDSFDDRVGPAWRGGVGRFGIGDGSLPGPLIELELWMNSIEEMLEYLAGLFLLAMIGTLFSIEPIGGDRRSGAGRA